MKPEITAETNLKKERATPVPKNAHRILEGALRLPLFSRIAIRNDLTTSIDNELKKLETDYNEAKKLITGQ